MSSNGRAINGNAKRSYKLMIVDDSNIMRRRIERSQQFEELQLVGTAGNGVEALELFLKCGFAIERRLARYYARGQDACILARAL